VLKTTSPSIFNSLPSNPEETLNLFQAMGLGALYCSSDGAILFANPSAGHILNGSPNGLVGRKITDPSWKMVRQDGSLLLDHQHPASLAFQTGETITNAELRIQRFPSASSGWYQVTAVPEFHPGQETPYRVCVVFTDISRYKQIEDRLNQREIELKAFYTLSEIAEMKDITLHEIYQRTINTLPESWQHAELACGKIEIEGQKYVTENYIETRWVQSSAIFVNGD
jgi:hypothetical protein